MIENTGIVDRRWTYETVAARRRTGVDTRPTSIDTAPDSPSRGRSRDRLQFRAAMRPIIAHPALSPSAELLFSMIRRMGGAERSTAMGAYVDLKI